MALSRRFSKRLVNAFDQSKILGVRAGSEPHRFIGIWVVVAEGRVFVRSWDRKAGGWYHTLRREPVGVLQIGDAEIKVRAVFTRSERLRDAVDRAYAAKYPTPGSVKYVRGFKSAGRRATTTEFVPFHRGR